MDIYSCQNNSASMEPEARELLSDMKDIHEDITEMSYRIGVLF